jgi:hypothetical protein
MDPSSLLVNFNPGYPRLLSRLSYAGKDYQCNDYVCAPVDESVTLSIP